MATACVTTATKFTQSYGNCFQYRGNLLRCHDDRSRRRRDNRDPAPRQTHRVGPVHEGRVGHCVGEVLGDWLGGIKTILRTTYGACIYVQGK